MATKTYIIALEEHYFDPEVKRHTVGQEPTNALVEVALSSPTTVTATVLSTNSTTSATNSTTS